MCVLCGTVCFLICQVLNHHKSISWPVILYTRAACCFPGCCPLLDLAEDKRSVGSLLALGNMWTLPVCVEKSESTSWRHPKLKSFFVLPYIIGLSSKKLSMSVWWQQCDLVGHGCILITSWMLKSLVPVDSCLSLPSKILLNLALDRRDLPLEDKQKQKITGRPTLCQDVLKHERSDPTFL